MRILAVSIFFAIPLYAQCAEWPATVEVFVDTPSTVTWIAPLRAQGVEIEIFNVASVKKIELELSRTLFDNERNATLQAQTRLARLSSKAAIDIVTGAQALYRAQGYGIEKFPAVVFDSKLIIYHTSNLRRAIAIWRRSQ